MPRTTLPVSDHNPVALAAEHIGTRNESGQIVQFHGALLDLNWIRHDHPAGLVVEYMRGRHCHANRGRTADLLYGHLRLRAGPRV